LKLRAAQLHQKVSLSVNDGAAQQLGDSYWLYVVWLQTLEPQLLMIQTQPKACG